MTHNDSKAPGTFETPMLAGLKPDIIEALEAVSVEKAVALSQLSLYSGRHLHRTPTYIKACCAPSLFCAVANMFSYFLSILVSGFYICVCIPNELINTQGIPCPSRLGKPDEFASLAEHIINNAYLNGEVSISTCLFLQKKI